MDFLNPNAKYELLANNVPRVCGATGGLLQNSPIVCGGQPEMEIKKCKQELKFDNMRYMYVYGIVIYLNYKYL